MKQWAAILIYLGAFLLQSTVGAAWPVFGVSGDLLLVLSILVPFCYGGWQGSVYGIIFGLLRDICFGVLIGPSALLYFVISLLVLVARQFFYGEKLIPITASVVLGTLFFCLADWAILQLFGQPYSFLVMLKGFPVLLLHELAGAAVFYWLIGRKAFHYPQDRWFHEKSYWS